MAAATAALGAISQPTLVGRQPRINLRQSSGAVTSSSSSSSARRPMQLALQQTTLFGVARACCVMPTSAAKTSARTPRSTQSHFMAPSGALELHAKQNSEQKCLTRSSMGASQQQGAALFCRKQAQFWKSSASSTSGGHPGAGDNKTPVTEHRRAAFGPRASHSASGSHQHDARAQERKAPGAHAKQASTASKSCYIVPSTILQQQQHSDHHCANGSCKSAPSQPHIGLGLSVAVANSRLRQGTLFARRQAHLQSVELALQSGTSQEPHETSASSTQRRQQLASALHKQRLRRGASLVAVSPTRRTPRANESRTKTVYHQHQQPPRRQINASCQALNVALQQRPGNKLTASTCSLTLAMVKRPRQNPPIARQQRHQPSHQRRPAQSSGVGNKGRRWSTGVETSCSSRSSTSSASSLCSSQNPVGGGEGRGRATSESRGSIATGGGGGGGPNHNLTRTFPKRSSVNGGHAPLGLRKANETTGDASPTDVPTCAIPMQTGSQHIQRRSSTTGNENRRPGKQTPAISPAQGQSQPGPNSEIEQNCANIASHQIQLASGCHHIPGSDSDINVASSRNCFPSAKTTRVDSSTLLADSQKSLSNSCLENNSSQAFSCGSPISVDCGNSRSLSNGQGEQATGGFEPMILSVDPETSSVFEGGGSASGGKHPQNSSHNQGRQSQQAETATTPLGSTLTLGASQQSIDVKQDITPSFDNVENDSEFKMMISTESPSSDFHHLSGSRNLNNNNNSSNNNNNSDSIVKLSGDYKIMDNDNHAKPPLGPHQSININHGNSSILNNKNHDFESKSEMTKLSPLERELNCDSMNCIATVDKAGTSREIPIRSEPISEIYNLEARPFARGKFAQVKRCARKDNPSVCFAAKCIKKRRRQTDIRHEILLEIEALKLSYQTEYIVKLHEVYEAPNEMFLVLEMAQGGELQRVLDDEEQLEEQMARKFVRQILDGLIFLHDNQIAHLDIKPQNLLLTKPFPDGDIKLCDFGISRRITEGCEIRDICGTPDYVAPEILRYDPISLATDMWSVGVLTYVLLSGYSPFGSENKQQTFCNITQGDLDFPVEIFGSISQDAVDFVRKLIVREPSARLTSRQARKHIWLDSD